MRIGSFFFSSSSFLPVGLMLGIFLFLKVR